MVVLRHWVYHMNGTVTYQLLPSVPKSEKSNCQTNHRNTIFNPPKNVFVFFLLFRHCSIQNHCSVHGLYIFSWSALMQETRAIFGKVASKNCTSASVFPRWLTFFWATQIMQKNVKFMWCSLHTWTLQVSMKKRNDIFLCLFLGIWGVCKPIASFNRMFPGYEGLDWDCYCSLHHVVFTSGHKCEYGTFGICLFVSQRRRCPKHSTEKKATTFKFQCGARNMSTIWVGTITSRGMTATSSE